jgi:D-sedoheptulose 7-phosphate isomerase
MHTHDYILEELRSSHETVGRLLLDTKLIGQIEATVSVIIAAYRSGGKVLLAGNGGSAADAQHIAAVFVSRLKFDRAPLAALALTADTSIVTAIGNDYGYAQLFARQVRAYGRKGDVFIGITTSGRSENVLQAFVAAKELGLTTVALCGEPALANGTTCDHLLACPSAITAQIQECHIIVAHILCGLVERNLFRPST